jgi:chromosome segregation ATPase
MDCNSSESSIKNNLNELESLKAELGRISEDAYKRREEVKSGKTELDMLEDQMRIVEKNQEGLQSTLTKLKAKQDTYRVRANGAVCVFSARLFTSLGG